MAGPTTPDPDSSPAASDDRRPRIAYLSFSTGEYDARFVPDGPLRRRRRVRGHPLRALAPRSAADRAARRVSPDPRPARRRLIVPGLAAPPAAGLRAQMAEAARHHAAEPMGPDKGVAVEPTAASAPPRAVIAAIPLPRPRGSFATRRVGRGRPGGGSSVPRGAGGSVLADLPGAARWPGRSRSTRSRSPRTSGTGCGRVRCPPSARCADVTAGRTIYDSRDVYMLSREFSAARAAAELDPGRLERRWARSADRVLTVNEAYADLLTEQLGLPARRSS